MPTIAGVQYPKGWTPGSVVTFDGRTGTVVDRAPQGEAGYATGPIAGYWFWVTPTGADFRETVRVRLNSKTGHACEDTDRMYLDDRQRRSLVAHVLRTA